MSWVARADMVNTWQNVVVFTGILRGEGLDDPFGRMWSVLQVSWVVMVEMVHLAECVNAAEKN